MDTLAQVLSWQDDAAAFAETERGEKIIVRFTHVGDNGEWSIWTFYDENKLDREMEDVHQAMIELDPADTSQEALMNNLRVRMHRIYGLCIDDPIWTRVQEELCNGSH